MRRLVALGSVIAVLAFGTMAMMGQRVLAQDATPDSCPTITEADTAALMTQFYEAVGTGEDVSPFFAEGHVAHTSRGMDLPDSGPQWFEDRWEDFPDLTVTTDIILTQDDKVAVYESWSGTQQAPYEMFGAPATGKYAEWTSITIYRIECGQIVDLWPVPDNLDLMMDLGVITEEELQSADVVATPTS